MVAMSMAASAHDGWSRGKQHSRQNEMGVPNFQAHTYVSIYARLPSSVSSLDAELRLDASRVRMEWHISPFLSHACQHAG
jgi:hypothetical protein